MPRGGGRDCRELTRKLPDSLLTSCHSPFSVSLMSRSKPQSVLADAAEIKRLRQLKGWSAAQLAEQAEIGRTSVWYIEERGRPCRRVVLWSIANALGVTMQDITAPADGSERKTA